MSKGELDLQTQMNARIEENLYEQLHPKFNTDKAVAHEPLTIETLQEAMRNIKRRDYIYVIASNMVPNDAYGVLFLREADARKWKK